MCDILSNIPSKPGSPKILSKPSSSKHTLKTRHINILSNQAHLNILSTPNAHNSQTTYILTYPQNQAHLAK
jgi:hypothetical protein